MKRIFVLILSIVMLISLLAPAYAQTLINPRASLVIDETITGLRFEDDRVYGMGSIVTVDTADIVGILTMTLYEKNGTSWSRLTGVTTKYGYNTDNYAYTISAPATRGKQYKVTATFYGKIGENTDTHAQNSIATYT